MSRRANPLDNAPMGSFFYTLKTELVHHRTYATRDEAKRDLFSYVEGFYNRQRLRSALDYRTPNEAERQAANAAEIVEDHDADVMGFGHAQVMGARLDMGVEVVPAFAQAARFEAELAR